MGAKRNVAAQAAPAAALAAMLAGVMGAAAPAHAQHSSTVEARGSVTIIDPPALGKGSEISVAPISQPGRGGVTAQAVSGRYEVSGVAGDSYNIAMPSSLRLTRSDGVGEVMLQLTPSGAVNSLPGAYGGRGSRSVAVQGEVGVQAGAAPGVYKGSFPVILSLQ